ncbi:hypothetical protein AYI70_g1447 [Smittium culicis]|uniref:Uncharacterized protein n=1 Tax=Smittium culicis TaxID=133412 RepID=A0A1R1YCL7_9FUNG|nr:hypothetical protein AYI70_g1447 [Smittium culicis]
MALPALAADAQFGSWVITDPSDASKVVTYNNGTGYYFFLLRGNLSSSNCGSIDSYSQYGCVYSAKCTGEGNGSAQCPTDVYYSAGTTAVCNEYVSLIGKTMIAQYQITCNVPFSTDRNVIKNTNALDTTALADTQFISILNQLPIANPSLNSMSSSSTSSSSTSSSSSSSPTPTPTSSSQSSSSSQRSSSSQSSSSSSSSSSNSSTSSFRPLFSLASILPAILLISILIV